MGFMRTSEAMNAAAFSSDEERWAAVVRRDRRADGTFYYSVRTTGVYCRPSCASRPALRKECPFPRKLRSSGTGWLPGVQALPAECARAC